MAQPQRSATSRTATQRALDRGAHRGRLHVDAARIPADKKYIWVRENVLGQPDSENVADRMRDDWLPVPADRHPEMMPPVLDGAAKASYIRRGGQILMELPLAEWQARQDDLVRENAEIVASVDRDRHGTADKNFPATKEISSKTERNGRFFTEEN